MLRKTSGNTSTEGRDMQKEKLDENEHTKRCNAMWPDMSCREVQRMGDRGMFVLLSCQQ